MTYIKKHLLARLLTNLPISVLSEIIQSETLEQDAPETKDGMRG